MLSNAFSMLFGEQAYGQTVIWSHGSQALSTGIRIAAPGSYRSKTGKQRFESNYSLKVLGNGEFM